MITYKYINKSSDIKTNLNKYDNNSKYNKNIVWLKKILSL